MDTFISLFTLLGIIVTIAFGTMLSGFLFAYITDDDDGIMFGSWMSTMSILVILIIYLLDTNGYLF